MASDNLEQRAGRGHLGLGKRILMAGAAGLAGLLSQGGCGGGKGGAAPDTTPPAVVVNDPLNEGYSRSDTVEVTVTDTGGVAEVRWEYGPVGGTLTSVELTNVGGNVYRGIVPISGSGDVRGNAYARDVAENISRTTTTTVEKYALENEGDAALETRLNEYLLARDILDYRINAQFDCDGTIVNTDAAVFLEDPSHPGDPDFGYWTAGWYQGETDGDHAADKAALTSYGIPWSQINGCKTGEIAPGLDAWRAAGYPSGYVVPNSKPKDAELEEFLTSVMPTLRKA